MDMQLTVADTGLPIRTVLLTLLIIVLVVHSRLRGPRYLFFGALETSPGQVY